jgi:hypothetical protein
MKEIEQKIYAALSIGREHVTPIDRDKDVPPPVAVVDEPPAVVAA